MKYYAFYLIDEDITGITDSWEDCQEKCKNKKSRYKSFKTKKEAKLWLDSGAEYESKKENIIKLADEQIDKKAIYFDAGTGRGKGVEVRITDSKKNSLFEMIVDKKLLNEYGNFVLSKDKTNNYGELTGLYAALKFAIKYNINKIAGDSKLVIEYWSKGIYNDNLDRDTINLILKVKKMSDEFIKKGGEIIKISGDINPADLGFHK